MKILSIFNCLCKWFLMFLFWISRYNCTFSKCLNMWLIKVSSFLFLIIFLLRKPSLCDKVWVIPSMQNVHGIRIYNCEVESILAFIALCSKLLAEAQMEVQHCELLCWQLPVRNELVLTFHLPCTPQLLFFVCESLHLSQISAWLLKHVAVSWCSARRAFFF